jgi:hypothetical protein
MTSIRRALILGAVAGAAGLVGPRATQAAGPPGIMRLLMASQPAALPVGSPPTTPGTVIAPGLAVAAPVSVAARPPGQPPGRPPDSQPLPGNPANN